MVIVPSDDAQVIGRSWASSAGARVAARLEDQLGWYEQAAGRARLWFRGPSTPTVVIGVLGAGVVVRGALR
jgi:hypothetical protein